MFENIELIKLRRKLLYKYNKYLYIRNLILDGNKKQLELVLNDLKK